MPASLDSHKDWIYAKKKKSTKNKQRNMECNPRNDDPKQTTPCSLSPMARSKRSLNDTLQDRRRSRRVEIKSSAFSLSSNPPATPLQR